MCSWFFPPFFFFSSLCALFWSLSIYLSIDRSMYLSISLPFFPPLSCAPVVEKHTVIRPLFPLSSLFFAVRRFSKRTAATTADSDDDADPFAFDEAVRFFPYVFCPAYLSPSVSLCVSLSVSLSLTHTHTHTGTDTHTWLTNNLICLCASRNSPLVLPFTKSQSPSRRRRNGTERRSTLCKESFLFLFLPSFFFLSFVRFFFLFFLFFFFYW